MDTIQFIYIPQQEEIANLRREFARARGLAQHMQLRSGDLSRTLADLALMVRALEHLGIRKGLFTRDELGASMREVLTQDSMDQRPASTPAPAARRKPLRGRLRRK